MRVLVMAGLVGAALAAPAAACPEGARCIALRTKPTHFTSFREISKPAPARKITLVMRATVEVDTTGHALRSSLTSYEPATPEADDAEPATIWTELAAEARSRLPRSDRREFSIVVQPVVVSTVDESNPGLGVSGKF